MDTNLPFSLIPTKNPSFLCVSPHSENLLPSNEEVKILVVLTNSIPSWLIPISCWSAAL